ncbi:MAG TPA: hypothetical protein VHG51_02065 [Longimicrobiaceae bacterium]|nr:hypothetical protein [Longimicrobiaceae bacterium]
MHPSAPSAPPEPAPAPAPAEPAPPPAQAPEPSGRHVPWRTVLREFATIVAGVLCALAAQAWWEGRQERGREHDYLRQLLADTRENERRLEAAIAEDEATHANLRRLVGALHGPGALPPGDSLMRWMVRSGSASDFQPVSGTLGALLTTGDLRLVRNDSLRALLVSYAAGLESENHRLRQLREATMGVAAPMGRSLPFMRGLFLGEPRADRTDWERLRDDPELWAVLLPAQAANANRLSGLERAREETLRVRRALEAEVPRAADP